MRLCGVYTVRIEAIGFACGTLHCLRMLPFGLGYGGDVLPIFYAFASILAFGCCGMHDRACCHTPATADAEHIARGELRLLNY